MIAREVARRPVALRPTGNDHITTKPSLRARIKEWFRFDIEALGNAGIAISGVYGAPIAYVPLDVSDRDTDADTDEKH